MHFSSIIIVFHFARGNRLKKQGRVDCHKLGNTTADVLSEAPTNIFSALMWHLKLELVWWNEMSILRSLHKLYWLTVPAWVVKLYIKRTSMFGNFHLYGLLLLPDKLPICAWVMVGLHGQTAQNALPEMFRVILCCTWDNCVKIFNQINHEDKLICITALILTGLIITTKFIALLNANYHWDDPHPFNNSIYHRRPRPDNH